MTILTDYLIQVNDIDDHVETISLWATKLEEEWTFHLPYHCDCLPVFVYSELGVEPTINEEGEVTVLGVPPTLAGGQWFIVSIPSDVPVPEPVAIYVITSGNRDVGIALPEDIVGLSTIWAGMILNGE